MEIAAILNLTPSFLAIELASKKGAGQGGMACFGFDSRWGRYPLQFLRQNQRGWSRGAVDQVFGTVRQAVLPSTPDIKQHRELRSGGNGTPN